MNGEEGATELPTPATFVLDRNGIVQLAYVDENDTCAVRARLSWHNRHSHGRTADAWRPITKAVQDEGGLIFQQLWQAGRYRIRTYNRAEYYRWLRLRSVPPAKH